MFLPGIEALPCRIPVFENIYTPNCNMFIPFKRSRGSSVSDVTNYRHDYQGSIPEKGLGSFPLATVSRLPFGLIQPRVQMQTEGSFPRGKTLGA
jgi:hypothetical protein